MALESETNRLADPDAAYRLLIEAHRGLSEADSAALNARLVLILAHQVGDIDALRKALQLAAPRGDAERPSSTQHNGPGASGG